MKHKNTVHFSLINNLSELEKLHATLSHFGEQNGLDPKTIFQMTLVSEEIFTNIIAYGYADTQEHSISFTLSCKERELTIMIKDDAQPFNPLEADPPDMESEFEKRQVGGLGIHIIKTIMDDVTYTRQDNTNLIILRKRIDVSLKNNH